ncbi:T9SS type A sorting domain-containing protein [Halpernia sp.]|uniref:type IX secretion system anionic LPS delivery protein PorZ n=1 Tax=Halpernia sp. TaxID=2782209 RepID=UPI003A8E159D
MRKKLILFCLIIGLSCFKSQNISSGKWNDLFSYNNVLVMREDSDRIIAATENGLFFYNPSSGEITKLSKANGLHEVKISAFDYNPVTKIGLVGYVSGAMDVITPEGIFLIVDIPIATGYTGTKKINHISISGNNAVISVGYGVSIFRLDKREFGDTAFFSNGGVYTAANESIIKDNVVYSATSTGIKSHEMNVSFPLFSSWNTPIAGNFTQISADTDVYAGTSTQVFKGNGAAFASFITGISSLKDITSTGGKVIISDLQKVSRYTDTGTLEKTINVNETLNTAIQFQNQIYTGTKLSGIFNESLQPYKPDGPYSNISYKISLLKDEIYVSTGGRENYNTPVFNGVGYYHFNGTEWKYPVMFNGLGDFYNILDVVPNPAKPGEVFFTNYSYNPGYRGIIKMQDDIFVKKYDDISLGQYYKRMVGITFDENNQLFVSASFLVDGKGSGGFYAYNSSSDNFTLLQVSTMNGAQKPFAKDGILYLPGSRTDGGILLYDYKNTPVNSSDDVYKVLNKSNNLPESLGISATLDKSDDLWIGTSKGLRILQNPKDAITADSPQTENIVIEQNGIPEELFRDAAILQIAVDSGNQKWISVDGGGVFYISSDGQQTFQHFTKANSPLPTDTVTDIKVDEKTGKVYFVTLDGIVTFQGDVVNVTSDFGDVLVYPNPVVYANYKGNVKIRGLAQKTNIRITDAAGNLVHSAVARGGYYEWDLNNQRGRRVASGIYFVLMTNEDGTDTATAKIAVVN